MSEVYISCPYRKFMRQRPGRIHDRQAAYSDYPFKVGYIVAILGEILTGVAGFTGGFAFNRLNLIAMALFFGLAYGVYRKSRACAAILFIYYIGLNMSQRAATNGIERFNVLTSWRYNIMLWTGE